MIKVQDLAKKMGQTTREFMRFLNEVNIKAKSLNTKIDKDTEAAIRELFQERLSGQKAEANEEEIERRTVVLKESNLTVSSLMAALEVSTADMMKAILSKGLLLNLNSPVDEGTSIGIADAIHIDLVFDDVDSDQTMKVADLKEQLAQMDEDASVASGAQNEKRPPVVALMGHVDHGKTKLLDAIRKANVADKESGGITQHIGAYQVVHNESPITFLDTPGHEAFTALRSRGAQVTDVAILVVAADEGVKPQTLEAIDHIKAAEVPIIVALNKMDKPDANVDQVKTQLSTHGLVAEDYGGDVVMAPVSALNGTGIDELLEMVELVSDVLELSASVTGNAKGVIIESQLSTQRGPVATVLVKTGTLKKGDFFAVGPVYGKVKALTNDQGKQVSSAGPGVPVEILGISEVPSPGDIFEVFSTEKAAKEFANEKYAEMKSGTGSLKTVSLETLSQQIESGDLKQLNLIVKADVNGSLEAILSSIGKIPTDEVSIRVLHAATGPITENDLMLARSSQAYIVSFNIPITNDITRRAEEIGVSTKEYRVIYNLLDDVRSALEGMFSVEFEELETGRAEVRDIFRFSKVGVIAGSYVTDGRIVRQSIADVLRDGESVYKGKVSSLKRFKDDVKEVVSGYECGIVLDGFQDFKAGDIIVAYELREKKKSL